MTPLSSPDIYMLARRLSIILRTRAWDFPFSRLLAMPSTASSTTTRSDLHLRTSIVATLDVELLPDVLMTGGEYSIWCMYPASYKTQQCQVAVQSTITRTRGLPVDSSYRTQSKTSFPASKRSSFSYFSSTFACKITMSRCWCLHGL